MSFLVVQLSDIHIRFKSDPIVSRVQNIVSAISSIMPRSQNCLLVVTGDVAMNGESAEYVIATQLFDQLLEGLKSLFTGKVECVFLPGNHDCLLPKREEGLRKVIVDGLSATLQLPQPDASLLREALAPQHNWDEFSSRYRGIARNEAEKICESYNFSFDGDSVRILCFNTALLTQRKETPGTLSLPLALVEKLIDEMSQSLVTITAYHHPDNWLDPSTRRSFRKLVESTAHLALTGHEHQADARQVLPESGGDVSYYEADALQEESYSQNSAFACLAVNPSAGEITRHHFKWKKSLYVLTQEPVTKRLSFTGKSKTRFDVNEKFSGELLRETFGFTHLRKRMLSLTDIFVYPSIAVDAIGPNSKVLTVKGSAVFDYVVKEKRLLFQGSAFSGKTSLLKTLYNDILRSSRIVPILINGEDLTSSSKDAFYAKVCDAFRNQYSSDMLDAYKQLPPARRALLIDNIHKSRLREEVKREVLKTASEFFEMTLVTSSELISLDEIFEIATGDAGRPSLRSTRIKEFSASARGALIDKWMRVELPDDSEEEALSRELERTQSVLDYLIGKKTLPSLPYLILGVLQARQQQQEVSDPGSFGFLVQKLILDSLSVTKGKRKLIERKDALLRRVSFHMFVNGVDDVSVEDFEELAAAYSKDSRVTIDSKELLEDLIYGRIFTNTEGNLTYTYKHFYFYFLARHFIDEIDGPREQEIRKYLDTMADQPLAKSNQQTLIFFLFFRKRDPVIDRIIKHADKTFASYEISDMKEDVAFLELKAANLEPSTVDPEVDTKVERSKRLDAQDQVEQQTGESPATSLVTYYDDALAFHIRNQFATARLELLGQVIRSFPDSLDGDQKIKIISTAVRLGLRTLRGTIEELRLIMMRGIAYAEQSTELSPDEVKEAKRFVRNLVALFVRGCCDSRLLSISRAVGVADLETAYSEAISDVGDANATKLVALAIKLDHGEGFPFKEIRQFQKSVGSDNRLAIAVMTDLVVRHTQIFKHTPAMLRSIAGSVGIKPMSLVDKSVT